ncbi:hypothetical protein EJB05_08650, partial [Eragrostis curvula]
MKNIPVMSIALPKTPLTVFFSSQLIPVKFLYNSCENPAFQKGPKPVSKVQVMHLWKHVVMKGNICNSGNDEAGQICNLGVLRVIKMNPQRLLENIQGAARRMEMKYRLYLEKLRDGKNSGLLSAFGDSLSANGDDVFGDADV